MFAKLYLDSTNPELTLSELYKPKIFYPMIISIIFHTIIYVSFCNMISWIFVNKTLSNEINQKLIYCLLLIMIFGFIGRLYNVKDIYKAYGGNMEKTRNHLDKNYITWIFLS
jgi:hypothetical protein